MTRLSRIQRNCRVLSVPLLLGGVVYTTAVYGASLLVAQDQEPGGSGKHRVILPTEVQPGGGAGGSKPSFGGSGGGTGGMGGMGSPLVLIEWKKPQGEKPDWLIRGEKAFVLAKRCGDCSHPASPYGRSCELLHRADEGLIRDRSARLERHSNEERSVGTAEDCCSTLEQSSPTSLSQKEPSW